MQRPDEQRAVGTAPGGAGAARRRNRRLIAGLGVAQIVSWGTFYYSFPLIAEPLGRTLGLDKPDVYGALTFGLVVAALAAYPVGAAIDRGRGRAVMALGSLIGGLFLLAWGRVEGLWSLYAVLAGIGLVQAMTLYEPAFAVVAHHVRGAGDSAAEARHGITALTLWGGFASTVFVPLIQLLLDRVGWRDTLLVLGLVNLTVCVALHLAVIAPHGTPVPKDADAAPAGTPQGRHAVRRVLGLPTFWGLAVAFTAYYAAISALTFHLYPMLIERGFDAATVVGAIAIIGPSQVAGRVVLWTVAGRQPVRTIGALAVGAFPVALLILWGIDPGFAALAAFAVLYGVVNGVMTIVRGLAVPEMVSREAYGAINGALSLPATGAKAAAPAAAALLWAATGTYDIVLLAILAAALAAAAGFWTAVLCSRGKTV